MISPTFDIIVVSSHHRPALVSEYLVGIDHKISLTPDYDQPIIQLSESARKLRIPFGPGPYRCFRGHQDALSKALKDHILIFEDDAVPNRSDWLDVCEAAVPLLSKFDVVSLHGRNQKGIERQIIQNGFSYNVLAPVWFKGQNIIWAQGSLAYLVNRQTAARIMGSEAICACMVA
jgi:GR25 family glycosyltransferase involved in LPS biosynthesis